MPAATRKWTAEEVRNLSSDSRRWPRYELIDGELLVTPAPRNVHQFVITQLLRLLAEYVDDQRLGLALTAPADLELELGTVTQPDIFVVPYGSLRDGKPWHDWSQVARLLLAVEVISPGSVRHDRVTKRKYFQRVGVPDYWVVDADERTFERWRPEDREATVFRGEMTWFPALATMPFELDVAAFFNDVFARLERVAGWAEPKS
ncbi:MAG: Uma2 family endonuclease [Gemmatimonadota bacterium]